MSKNQTGEAAVNIVGRDAKRMWCRSCQTEGDVLGFCDCANPVYLTAREWAAAAIAANPDKSDRAIAAETGVSDTTVLRARRQLTASNEAVVTSRLTESTTPTKDKPKKRVGLDGKARKMPTRNADRRAAAVAQSEKAAALLDARWNAAQIAAELGVSKRYAEVILEKIAIGRAGATAAGGDPDALRPTDTQRLARAIRQAELAFEVRVLEECKRRIETLSLPLYRKEQDEARAIIKNRPGFMSLSAFTKISSLLHPDRVQDEGLKAMHAEAFEMFRRLKVVLVKESEFRATPAPDVPRTYADLMEQRRQAMAARRKSKGGGNVVMH